MLKSSLKTVVNVGGGGGPALATVPAIGPMISVLATIAKPIVLVLSMANPQVENGGAGFAISYLTGNAATIFVGQIFARHDPSVWGRNVSLIDPMGLWVEAFDPNQRAIVAIVPS